MNDHTNLDQPQPADRVQDRPPMDRIQDGPDPHNPDPGRTEHVPDGTMSVFTRIAAVVFIVGAVAFWAFAFSPQAREMFQARDQIFDETYAAAIETRCAITVAEMDALPSSRTAESPEARGLIVEQANASLMRMQIDLGNLSGGIDDDRELVAKWLDDWDFYIDDRQAHAEKLSTGYTGRFLNTERDDIFIAERMSGFARRNDIRSCMPPGDL